MAIFAGLATDAIQYILEHLREEIANRDLDLRRLPGWVRSERIRLGWVNSSLVAVVEDAPEGGVPESRVLGAIGADTVALLGVPNFQATSAALKAPSGPNFLAMVGSGTPEGASGKATTIVMGYQGAFFNTGFAGYHGPTGIFNMFFDMIPDPELPPVASSYVPMALYIHENDLHNLGDLWGRMSPNLVAQIVDVHDSELGSFYETHKRPSVFTIAAGSLHGTKESGVLILGAYSPKQRKDELMAVANILKPQYSPVLIDQLPDEPGMSLDQKAAYWGQSARFCIMVDIDAAGHIREYGDLLNHRAIVALLRPTGTGSTHMIGAERLVDVNYVEVFEFEQTPAEVLPQAVAWAESVVANRIREYDRYYPWRRSPTDDPG